MHRLVRAAMGLVCALGAMPAQAQPSLVHHEGLLLDDGRPIEGQRALTFRLYREREDGRALWEERHAVRLVEGYYSVLLGSEQDFPAGLFDGDLHLGVAIDGGAELRPRTRFVSVPFALRARTAVDVTGDIHPRSVSIGGNVVIDRDGRWVGDPTGLQGPPGPRGPPGPPGPAGGDGSPDTPLQVRDKLWQVDGSGSRIDADLLDGVDSAAFMRADQDTETRGDLAVGGNVAARGVVVGRSFSVSDRRVISEDGRWVGSSEGLDADTLDGFDSSDFLRAGALENLDLEGGALQNVGRITPGGDRAQLEWVQTTLADFGAGTASDVDFTASPGDLRLVRRDGGGGGARVVGEVGRLVLEENWRTVHLQGRYRDPVVVAVGPTENGGDGVTTRIRNIRADRFEVRLQEWDCHDGDHTTETLGWVVVERGHWDLGGGLEVEAGRFRTDQTGPYNVWATLRFQQAFPEAPVIASNLNSDNGGDSTGTWHHDVRPDRALISMVEDEHNDGHVTEDLGYIAVRPGSGVHDGRRWAAVRSGRDKDHQYRRMGFPARFPRTPVMIADLQSQFGGDSCQVRTGGLDAGGVSVRVHESCRADGPHTTEIIGVMAFEPGFRFVQNGGGGGGGGFAETGTHTSAIADFGSRVRFGRFSADATLDGEAIGIIVQVSNDGFRSVLREVSMTLRDGEHRYDETTALPPARYVRVRTVLRTRNAARTPVLHGYALDVTVGGTIDFGGANLVNIGKINANLYDPVYRIDGEFHATYLPENPEALVEVRGTARLVDGVARIELAKAPRDTPAWLFARAAEDVHAIVTPRGPASLYVASADTEAVVVKLVSGDPNVRFYYHLTGRRVDMSHQKTTRYLGDPSEVTTAIDPARRGIWNRGAAE